MEQARTSHVLPHHRELACQTSNQRDDDRQFDREQPHTKGGLSVQSELDDTDYEIGKKMEHDVMDSLSIKRCTFHGEWNYSVSPIPAAP